MRTELSNVLDLIRSGEDIVITQRGKPDIILTGKVEAKKSNEDLHDLISSPFFSSDTVKGILALNNQVNSYFNSPEVKENIQAISKIANKVHYVSKNFSEALLHTKIKHAEIIKKLEDK